MHEINDPSEPPEIVESILDSTEGFIRNAKGEVLLNVNGKPEWGIVAGLPSDSPTDIIDLSEMTDSIVEKGKNLKKPARISKKLRRGWSRAQTLALIDFYGKNKKAFASSTMRNDMVWKGFEREQEAEDESHDCQQIKDKWSALKVTFHKALDNRSNKATGAAAIHFEFFDEMYEILKDDPRAAPVAIASSAKGRQNIPPKLLAIEEFEDEGPKSLFDDSDGDQDRDGLKVEQIPKLKKTKFEQCLDTLHADRRKREDGVQQRHTEAMTVQRGFLQAITNMTESFKEYMGSKRKRESEDSVKDDE
ncbi:uncharacterized protein LOC107041883 [Diachasma alloeum]|uniref:uncharacterized protein LOC107041883 n=1 Tax=Diachasma alloeum TaxID=454923 RepID=UPI0007382E4C|nr:uncharacterized protein LOC107041883 [Diachasma alloeum]